MFDGDGFAEKLYHVVYDSERDQDVVVIGCQESSHLHGHLGGDVSAEEGIGNNRVHIHFCLGWGLVKEDEPLEGCDESGQGWGVVQEDGHESLHGEESSSDQGSCGLSGDIADEGAEGREVSPLVGAGRDQRGHYQVVW